MTITVEHIHTDTDPAHFLTATVDLDRGESPFGWSDAVWPTDESGR